MKQHWGHAGAFKLNLSFGNTCTSHSEPKLMTKWEINPGDGVFQSKTFSGKAHCKLELIIGYCSLPSMEQSLSNPSNSFILNLVVNLAVGMNFPSDNATIEKQIWYYLHL